MVGTLILVDDDSNVLASHLKNGYLIADTSVKGFETPSRRC